MENQLVLDKIKIVRELSPKRKFNQSFDMAVTLKALNLKKPEENVDLFITLPHQRGKQQKVCALIGRELDDQAKVFDKSIKLEEFPQYQDKKAAKKLASQYDFFIAQANLMGQIATVFGKTLGVRGKMPNPKAGAVVPPSADLTQLKARINKLIRLQTKKELIVKSTIAQESMSDEHIAENFLAAYNALVHALPQEEANIKEVFLKLTMGPSIPFSLTKEQLQERLEKKNPEVKKSFSLEKKTSEKKHPENEEEIKKVKSKK
ncbi:MAG TPA: hypothetical protein VJJ21_00225 [Candidatus Nanoarchaeia archaeon]|nr:hypothetical protein [Candidatus Nanoarchaeia archaeon]